MTNDSKLSFLCIGAPKCGTTWLHELLKSHSELDVPKNIKEVHYFDRYFSRGENWYHSLFDQNVNSRKKGETTPHYLYIDDVYRIYNYNPNIKLILILRDPVQRCISHYKFRQRLDNYQGTFSEFLVDYPNALEWSLYGKYLQRYLEIFPINQILVLNFEQAVQNIDRLKFNLSQFLDIKLSDFPVNAGEEKVNNHIVLKHPLLYRISVRISRMMVNLNLYKLRHYLKLALTPLIKQEKTSSASKKSIVHEHEITQLTEFFRDDQKLLQAITNISK